MNEECIWLVNLNVGDSRLTNQVLPAFIILHSSASQARSTQTLFTRRTLLLTLDAAQLKRQAAAAAVDFIESGMVIGLGAGSTALQAIIHLGERLKAGDLRQIVGVPCSKQVAEDAERYGVPLTSLDDHPVIDLTIEGDQRGRRGAAAREDRGAGQPP
jgi:hypothetical protein